MPEFNETTPRAPAKYVGIDFQVPQVFTAGHALTENEAKFVNRQVATVVGNTYGGRVRKALEDINEERAKAFKAKTYDGPMDATGKKPAPAEVKDLTWNHQAEFDTLFGDYELGVSNRGGGAGEPKDPIGAAAYAIASAKVREAIKANGLKVPAFYSAEASDPDKYNNLFNELVAQFTEANPWVTELAKSQIAAMQSHTVGGLNIALPPAPAEDKAA